MSTDATDFSLPNVGPGVAVRARRRQRLRPVLFQRDCTNCRKQVQSVAQRHDEFAERNTEIVWDYRSKTTFDRPSIDDLLAAVDEARNS